MGASEISSLAKAFQDYGIYFVAVVLGFGCVYLFLAWRTEIRERIADHHKHTAELVKIKTDDIGTDKDFLHAIQSLTEWVKERVRPHV